MIPVLYVATTMLLAFSLKADTGGFFPLELGNSWLYRMADGRSAADDRYRSISVDATETIGDREYFKVNYFGRPVLLRSDGDAIVTFDRASGTEKPWLALDQPEGASFATSIDPCSTTGRIMSREAEITIPAGYFDEAVQVGFRGNCADAGVTQQFYAAGVGLVSHEETSLTGPRRWELVYYRAGVRNGTGTEVSFTIALDAARYKAGSVIGVRMTLRSTIAEPLSLTFPSGQTYDFKIYNESGGVVYTWSAARTFIQLFREEKFGPGERSYGFSVPVGDLPPGRYKAQGYLTTSPILFTAESSFEIEQ